MEALHHSVRTSDHLEPTPLPSGAPWWMTHGGIVALVIVLLVLAVQFVVGAFASERGLHSDESAHFMNGLVLRDYLREGLGQSPLEFAREYYRHYPKIAPFMWPPLFHGMLGLFLLPGWAPTPAAIVLVGLCTSWIAWRLYRIVNSYASVPVAIGAVGLFLATPIVIDLSSSVMIDILVAACAIEAAYWLGRFNETGTTRDAVIFGAATALACLAKGNGLSVVMAPLALIAITGRLDLLRKPGLYLAAVIVLLLAAPLNFLAWYIDTGPGNFGIPGPALIQERLALYSQYLWIQLGTAPCLFAVVGIAAAFGRPRDWVSAHARRQAAALVSIVIGAFAFHLLNPHINSSGRYITLAIAPILGLAGLGVMAVAQPVGAPRLRWMVQLGVLGLMAAVHLASSPMLAAQAPLGYRAMAAYLRSTDELAGRRMLVVSNEQGEGAGVVEVAVLDLKPRPTVLRGSKVLASDDWMGNNFRLRYASPTTLLADLESMHVDYVVLDDAPEARALRYWTMVDQAMTQDPSRVALLRAMPALPTGPLRPLRLFKLRHPKGAPPPIDWSRFGMP